ncbi:MAG TPA: type IX secretion system membrane protein PorP/SprF [Cytophagaceae bacterium]
MRFFIILLFSAISTGNLVGQQLPLFSQYMFNGLVLNPALAGSNNALTIVLDHRSQWTEFNNAPTTQTLTIHSPLKNKVLNLGLIVTNDRYGITKRTDISQAISVRLPFLDGKLSTGISGGVKFIKNNWSNIVTSEDNDDAFSEQTNLVHPIIAMGLYFQNRNFYIGTSIPQLEFSSDPTYSQNLRNQRNRFYITSGVNIPFSEDIVLKPSILLKRIPFSPIQIDLNSMLVYKKSISGGLSLRPGNAIVFLIEYKRKQLSFGYAYDHLINTLKSINNSSHEIVLKYEFKYDVKVANPRNFN